jgi:RES domain-containing protein
LKFTGRCYRGHDPKWSFSPTSGDGAALTGGRFNRKGEHRLYLSLDIATAVGECTQGFANRLMPLTICEYDADIEPVADLRTDEARQALGIDYRDLDCAWKNLMLAGKEAPSWLVVDKLAAEGFAGILVPSFVPGAGAGNINIVLWQWGSDLPHQLLVFDPHGGLPSDQSSWSGPGVKP